MTISIDAKQALIQSNEYKLVELDQLMEAAKESLRAPSGPDADIDSKEREESRGSIVRYNGEIAELKRVNAALKRQIEGIERDEAEC